MTEHAPRNAFDIPKLFYFRAGNLFTGSRDGMRYRIAPEGEQMTVSVWYEDLCYELAQGQLAATETFVQTEEGFTAMLAWLSERHTQRKKA